MILRRFLKRLSAVVAVVVLLSSCVPLSVSAAYENTHVNTGNQAADLVAVAKTQIGYAEGSDNYNKYGKAYGSANAPWCGYFISWCARQAGVPTAVIPDSGLASDFGKKGTYHARNSGYIPQAGDLMLYGSRDDAYHVSIVERFVASASTVYVIDGNWSDKVSNHSTTLDDTEVAGFVTPSYTSKITELTALNMVVPTTLVAGNSFSISGLLYSPRKITAASVAVINAAGTTVTSNKATPNTTSYDLSNLDAGIKFGSLSAGTYSYVVTATDTKETKRWTYSFTVTNTVSMTIANVIVPSALKQGNTFSIAGKITCTEPLSNVAVSVYTAGGTYKTGGTAQPATTVYDISGVDAYVSFGSLAVGSYTMKITARSAHTNKTWEYPFTVTTGETFSLQGAKYPNKLTVGEAFSIAGKVVCSAKLSAVTVNILDASGNRLSTVTANPNTLTYDVSALDDDVPFSKLAAGSYTYRIGVRADTVRYEWLFPFEVGSSTIKGDIDGSGKVDTLDALFLYNYVNGSATLTTAQKNRIGVSSPDMMTALKLFNYAAGISETYP